MSILYTHKKGPRNKTVLIVNQTTRKIAGNLADTGGKHRGHRNGEGQS